jgi:hypothetical protein
MIVGGKDLCDLELLQRYLYNGLDTSSLTHFVVSVNDLQYLINGICS